MKILYVAYTDLGRGNEFRAEAINRCTGSVARCWALNPKYHSDPDLARTKMGLQEGVYWSDMIHLSDAPPYLWDLHKAPGFIVEFRGGYLRMASSTVWDWQLATHKPILTSAELGRYVPRFHYLPLPMDMKKFTVGKNYPETELPLKVVHTPTRRDYKDTDMLIEVCNELDDVELILVEGKSYEEALEAKRGADVCFGQIKVGDYGASEREAFCLGLAVIGRLQPISRVYNPGCPIISVANKAELSARLKELSEDPELCAEIKKKSRTWAERFLSYEAVAPRQEDLYEYILRDDPEKELWKAFSDIYRNVAKEEHNITTFIDPERLCW